MFIAAGWFLLPSRKGSLNENAHENDEVENILSNSILPVKVAQVLVQARRGTIAGDERRWLVEAVTRSVVAVPTPLNTVDASSKTAVLLRVLREKSFTGEMSKDTGSV